MKKGNCLVGLKVFFDQTQIDYVKLLDLRRRNDE